MALGMSGLARTLAFTALHDTGMPSGPDNVTALLVAFDRWLAGRPITTGETDLMTYTRTVYKKGTEWPTLEGRVPIITGIERASEYDVLARHAGLLWKVKFTKRLDAKSASTSIEMLSQGELLTLWQQISVLFGFQGMGTEMTDDERAKFLNPES